MNRFSGGILPGMTVRQSCHFGEWFQGRMGQQGPVVLVTLIPDGIFLRARRSACSHLAVKAPQMAAGFPVSVRALRQFLSALNVSTKGDFFIRPVFSPGLGTGASTAALIAIAKLAGFRGPAATLANATIAAEGASDPLMFKHPDRLLWASREGKVLAHGPAVPRAHLLTGFFGPPQPTRASDGAYNNISDLVAAWRDARTLSDFATIASESAGRCLARRGPSHDPTPHLAKDLGALGWSMSHSGAARALIFAPGTVPVDGPDLMREAGLRHVQSLSTGANHAHEVGYA